MQPVHTVAGTAIPFGAENVDTDVIINSRYLKVISRAGLGDAAFAVLREDPGNIFDQQRYRSAPILIAGENFGCGSSREHAVWALVDRGLKAIIAPSFADIFASNAFRNGLLLVRLPSAQVDQLLQWATQGEIAVNLERQTVEAGEATYSFEFDPFRKACLLNGLDEIALTLASDDAIAAFETRHAARRPWLTEVSA